MRRLIIVLALATAACTPPAGEAPPAPVAEAPSVDLGPYVNVWDSDAFSRFDHVLHAATPGVHTLTLTAQTNSPGGETVAVYPIGPDGQPTTARIMFVIATTVGNSVTAELTFAEGGAGVPVSVAVENAGGRRHAGSYTLTVTP